MIRVIEGKPVECRFVNNDVVILGEATWDAYHADQGERRRRARRSESAFTRRAAVWNLGFVAVLVASTPFI